MTCSLIGCRNAATPTNTRKGIAERQNTTPEVLLCNNIAGILQSFLLLLNVYIRSRSLDRVLGNPIDGTNDHIHVLLLIRSVHSER